MDIPHIRSLFRDNLRSRVALFFALFGVVVSLILAANLQMAVRELGQRLIDETLKAELEDYVARHRRNPLSLPPQTVTLLGYVNPPPPGALPLPALWQLLPAGYHDLSLDSIPYRAVVERQEDFLTVILYNLTQMRIRERSFLVFLGGGVLVMTLLSAVGGMWVAGHIVHPITELVRRVRKLGPEPYPLRLARGLPQDEVGELARAFDTHLERLGAFVERERFFAADVSHELRTPLAIIRGAVEVMQAMNLTLDERSRERFQRIERAIDDVTELTSALLLLSREADPRAPLPESCDLGLVIRDVVEKHRYLLRNRDTKVELQQIAQPQLHVERVLLQVALGNLVRNAFSYTPQGVVRILVETDTITIQDTGHGIRPEQMSRMFQRNNRGQQSQGAGIGLSLVKRICDRYRWEISVASREPMGTTIRIGFGENHPLPGTAPSPGVTVQQVCL
ncbi:MAG: HAMP domain-containing histidine kinase [Magnetococcus sp. WYHC-3]